MVAYSFKERFIRPIEIGLGSVCLSWDPPPKRQTIRAHGKRRHARPGEDLQLYYAMRTKQCRLIGRSRCVDVTPIYIQVGANAMLVRISGVWISGDELQELVRNDGFASLGEMHEFWISEHGLGDFKGVLIRWEPLTN